MQLKKGDKLYCKKTLFNVLGDPLFTEGHFYEILEHEGHLYYVNHILYGNEFVSFEECVIKDHFYTLNELRKAKLEKLKS